MYKSEAYQPVITRLLFICEIFQIEVPNSYLQKKKKKKNKPYTRTECHMEDTKKLKGKPENGEPFLFHMSENTEVGISGSLDQHDQPRECRLGLLVGSGIIGVSESIDQTFYMVKQVRKALA